MNTGELRRFCSEDYWNTSGTVPATLTYPSLTITLETGACALYEESVPDLGTPDLIIASKGLVCKSPVVRYSQVLLPSEPAVVPQTGHPTCRVSSRGTTWQGSPQRHRNLLEAPSWRIQHVLYSTCPLLYSSCPILHRGCYTEGSPSGLTPFLWGYHAEGPSLITPRACCRFAVLP